MVLKERHSSLIFLLTNRLSTFTYLLFFNLKIIWAQQTQYHNCITRNPHAYLFTSDKSTTNHFDDLKVYDPITFGFIHRNGVFGSTWKLYFLITPVKFYVQQMLLVKVISESVEKVQKLWIRTTFKESHNKIFYGPFLLSLSAMTKFENVI